MKIGFAITCYDKFEEANILIELIKEEFYGEYKITFCSNFKNGMEKAKDFKIDQYVQAREIPYFKGNIHKPTNLRDKVSIILRSTDSVLTSCREAIKMDVDYIVHMHSDAWCLSEEKLIEIVKEMKRLDKKIALRSNGIEKHRIGSICGVDDHFFIFEKKFAKENKVFEILPEEQFPHILSIHEILATNFLIKYGLSKIWCYRIVNELYNYDNTKVYIENTLRPVSYDPYYKFLHLHRASFPDNYGRILQAIYLRENTAGRSKFINEFIKKYSKDKKEVLKELKNIEEKYDKILKYSFYSLEILKNREISYKKKLVENFNITIPMKNLVLNILKFGYRKLINLKKKEKIDNIANYYIESIKIHKFVEEKWTKNLYYNKDIGLKK